MRVAVCTLQSVSPYSQSRPYEMSVPKQERENAKDYEVRTWRNRLHVTPKGFVYIPAMSFKYAITEAAAMLGMQIPGKGKATYRKFFESGILIPESPILPLRADDVPGDWLYLNSDGVRGSGKRVYRCMPRIDSWRVDLVVYITADEITPPVFVKHLEEAGKMVGIGRWRVRSQGQYGRWRVEKVEWQDQK